IMGCCPLSGSEDRADEAREHLISQNSAESHESVNCDGQEETIVQLKSTISEFEKLVEELKTEKQTLLTRLSEMSSVKPTHGDPNGADLSDPNRPDKLVEQFSELYDNQWTDSFQVLCERLGLSDEDAIQILLKIMMTVYDLCRQQVECQNKKLCRALSAFTGIEKIGDSLQSLVGSDVYIACQDYIAECIRVCWLMCINLPSMYISAETEEVFNPDLYTSYTKSGTKMSYVVWPALFQCENGPKLKKGIAQGTN
ncbi:hypothetical protein CHS0354_035515, partial [Potamilus streckersoni]